MSLDGSKRDEVCYDPELNGCLIYFLRRGVAFTMGSEGSTISLKGLGMLPQMLEIRNVDNRHS